MPFFMYQSKLNPHFGSLSRGSIVETGCGEEKSSGKTHDMGF